MFTARLNHKEQRVEIAKGIKNTDYLELDLSSNDNSDWQTAFDYFEKRIQERFIEPINILIESEKDRLAGEKKFGFTILALDFLLVETIQSFREGKTESNGKSKKVFCRFLTESDNFKEYFKAKFNAGEFYKNFRCGILHQSQTFGDTKVWAVGELIRKNGKFTIINRELFHKKLINEIEQYLAELRKQTNNELLKNFKIKMDFISGN
jgi:hypothetical protein